MTKQSVTDCYAKTCIIISGARKTRFEAVDPWATKCQKMISYTDVIVFTNFQIKQYWD